jgi:hypothetical protein
MQQLIRMFEFEGGERGVVSTWSPSPWGRAPGGFADRATVERIGLPTQAESAKLEEEDRDELH